MAIEALQSNSDVLFVWIRDWLIHGKRRLHKCEQRREKQTPEYRRKPGAGPVRPPAKSSEPT
jgi:hypothetical protein